MVLRAVNSHLIVAAMLLPLPAAFAAAWLFWRRGSYVIGNVVGLAVIFIACLVFAGSEYADGIRFRLNCEDAAVPCPPTGAGDFKRVALYGFIAMVQAMVLFVASGWRERRMDRAQYEERWR